jgi:hypothetical protein
MKHMIKHKKIEIIIGLISDLHAQLSNGDTMTVYTRESRVQPLPIGPYQNAVEGYHASKALALDAAEEFQSVGSQQLPRG